MFFNKKNSFSFLKFALHMQNFASVIISAFLPQDKCLTSVIVDRVDSNFTSMKVWLGLRSWFLVNWEQNAPLVCLHEGRYSLDDLLWTPTYGHTSGWLTKKDLHTSALCGHWMQSRGPAKSDQGLGWMERERERESQRFLCYLYQLIMMIIKRKETKKKKECCCCLHWNSHKRF